MAINSLNSMSHGLSGLASGMDTQSMVDAMLAGTQAKIDKQKANKAILGYKQSMYRDVFANLKSMQDNFFSFGSKTNLLLPSFYNNMTASSKSAFFKATANSGAAGGKTNVNSINQLATTFKKKAAEKASGDVSGKLNLATANNQEIEFMVDGVRKVIKMPPTMTEMTIAKGGADKVIKLPTPEFFGNGGMNVDKYVADLQSVLDTELGADPKMIVAKLPPTSNEITVTLDGVRKVIKLPVVETDAGGTPDAAKFAADLQKTIDRALGNGMKITTDGTNINFGVTEPSHQFMIQGSAQAMDTLGLTTGISNKINTQMMLKDINFKDSNKLQGSTFEFTINGTKFKFDENQTLSDVIQKVNNSDAGVEIRYSTLEDKFSIESSVSGSGSTIDMAQSEGNLLTALFGVGGGGAATGDTVYSYGDITGKIPGMEGEPPATMTADEKTKIDALLGTLNDNVDRVIRMGDKGKFELLLNGKKVTLDIPKKADDVKYTIDDIITAVDNNAELKAAGVKLEMTEDTNSDRNGGIKLTATAGNDVNLANGNFTTLGISGSTKKQATESSTLAQMGLNPTAADPLVIKIGNKTLTITDSSMTGKALSELMTQALKDEMTAQGSDPAAIAEAGISFDGTESKGRFRIFGVDIPMDFTIVSGDSKNSLLGTDKLLVGQTETAMDPVSAGQNSVMYINGQKVERSSNDFAIDGISYSLTGTFNEKYDGTEASSTVPAETIDVTRNTDQIFDGMVKFMEEYNKTLDKVWGMLKADPTYKEYPPLTDKQKAAMSESEVKMWEEKAREGLLRGDDTMEGIMSSMNSALTKRVGENKFSLADMGITTSYDFDEGFSGKLVFSDVTGQKLKDMIEQDPNAIEALFTDDEEGIATELNKILKSSTTDTAGIRNDPYANLSLVVQAGRPGVRDTNSNIYKEIDSINKNLETLGRKYESEYKRYWTQFNAMEQMISNMNQQSSWLTQQLGG